MSRRRPPSLAFQLLRAADWFDENLRHALVAAGFPALNQSHSRVFVLLGAGGVTPSDLARSVGMTRQSMQVLLQGLVDNDLVALSPDPRDGRRLVVRLAPRGEAMMVTAGAELRRLEKRFERHVGAPAMAVLRASLHHDWSD
jgi:DNA-binding MarR family transcriptional regulator